VDVIAKFKDEYSWLSNFSWYGFTDRYNVEWKTNEHYYQAHKTNDRNWRMSIRNCEDVKGNPDPQTAKKYGRRAPKVDNWEYIRKEVMEEGLRMKFDAHPKIKKLLLGTGNAELIEGNHWCDNYWGMCYCEKCEGTVGMNWLGRLLMALRADYQLAEMNME